MLASTSRAPLPPTLWVADVIKAPDSLPPVAAVPSAGIVMVILSLVALVKVKVIANPLFEGLAFVP